jgi:hypothetical protein
MSKIKKLSVGDIEEAADTQSRFKLSQETIDEYAEAMLAGAEFPPLDVFLDGLCYFIGDGWHRYYGYVKSGAKAFPCIIHAGTERDALLYAAGANKNHGLKRSNADKRRSVEIIFDDAEWSKWSDAKIAEHCGVHHDTVGIIRRQLAESASSPAAAAAISPAKRVGRDGKERPATKAKPAPPAKEEKAPPKKKGPDLAALAAPYQRAANDLTRIKRDMKAIAGDEKAGAHLAAKIVRIERDVDDLRASITQAEPLALCGKCDGEGCQHCARTGFWTRATVESRKK